MNVPFLLGGAAALAVGVAGSIWLAPQVRRRLDRHVRGSLQGRWGAGIGLVMGVVFGFGIAGIVLGSAFGAVLGEMVRDRAEKRAPEVAVSDHAAGSDQPADPVKTSTAMLFRAGGGSLLTFWCGAGWQILGVFALLNAL